jgi:hypothetical protein
MSLIHQQLLLHFQLTTIADEYAMLSVVKSITFQYLARFGISLKPMVIL